jgi:hypothetical protein
MGPKQSKIVHADLPENELLLHDMLDLSDLLDRFLLPKIVHRDLRQSELLLPEFLPPH